MKLIILLFLMISNCYAVNKQLAKDFNTKTLEYAESRKSKFPNKAVVFISSRADPDYMDVVEVEIDNNDVSDGKIQIQRPVSSSKMKAISTCKGEMGNVTISGTTLIVSTTTLPARLICTSSDGIYREAYTTFQK